MFQRIVNIYIYIYLHSVYTIGNVESALSRGSHILFTLDGATNRIFRDNGSSNYAYTGIYKKRPAKDEETKEIFLDARFLSFVDGKRKTFDK